MDAALRERLFPFLGGIARKNGMTALQVGGVADHVHMLISVPPMVAISKAMQQIKGASSRWVHESFPEQRAFAWQERYGAFTVSVSQLETIRRYIEKQEEHHRKTSFEAEFLALLRKHRVAFEEKYLWV